jgi:hypothetical protein
VTLTLDPGTVELARLGPDLDLAGRRAFGVDWTPQARSAALSGPSRVMTMERCVLLNPAHRGIEEAVLDVEVTPFAYDPRLGG